MSLSVCAEGTCYPANKNNVFPLIGLCVSYNYFDTLKYMLPINYMHFEKLYILTHEDDTDTIEFCGNFDNVEVLLYNFVNNGKRFDKYGAMNYAQHIIYKTYPDHWYLNIDSDIILPNNFINILEEEELNDNCIYGIVRNEVLKSSELMDKNELLEKNKNFHKHLFRGQPNLIVGFFQMYKKHIYQNIDFENAAYGDINFCYSFEVQKNLKNIHCFHLGPAFKNWNGKVADFIDDIKISLEDLYFNVEIKVEKINPLVKVIIKNKKNVKKIKYSNKNKTRILFSKIRNLKKNKLRN